MKIAEWEKTYDKLIDEGWTCSHGALYRGYKYSGSISPMRTKNGYMYCRIHHGKCKNISSGGYNFCCQITTVMRKPIK